jgi:hypothetical protein
MFKSIIEMEIVESEVERRLKRISSKYGISMSELTMVANGGEPESAPVVESSAPVSEKVHCTRHEDENLSHAYRYIYEYAGDRECPYTSYWLNCYLTKNEVCDDYMELKKINEMLLEGYGMMRRGYDKFVNFMDMDM